MVDSSYLNVHGNFFFFMFVCNLYYTFLSELQGNPSLGIELRTAMLFPKVVYKVQAVLIRLVYTLKPVT